MQVEKLKLETIQNECSMDKKQLNTLNKSMRKNLGAIKEDNKALTLSNSGCQAKLLKKDDEITNSLDSRNELTRELINIQGTLTDVSTRLSQCEEDLNEEKRDVVNNANENLAGGGSESMKIRCEKFQILEVSSMEQEERIYLVLGIEIRLLRNRLRDSFNRIFR